MYTLFIDTHYVLLHLALYRDGKVLDEVKKDGGQLTEYFISTLQDLLLKNHITIDDLSGIIVVNGPGSFTGVRIGVVVAKMIAYSKQIPIKVISFLQAVALKYPQAVSLGIQDKNGTFVGTFNKEHELVGDYFYLNHQESKDYPEKIIIDEEINLDMVYEYLKDKKDVHPHFVKPIYVKKIEVDK